MHIALVFGYDSIIDLLSSKTNTDDNLSESIYRRWLTDFRLSGRIENPSVISEQNWDNTEDDPSKLDANTQNSNSPPVVVREWSVSKPRKSTSSIRLAFAQRRKLSDANFLDPSEESE